MTTALDLIERTYLRLTGGVSEAFVQFNGAVASSTQGAITNVGLTGAQTQGITAGARLSSGLEIMLVISWSPTTGEAEVVRGYNGSQATSHNDQDIVYLNPEYTYFDILQAINDDLRDLSAPTNGVFRVGNANVTYVPVFMGFDLGDISSDFIDILSIRLQQASPIHKLPSITEWEVNRDLNDSFFPSGQGVVMYETGWPGKPMMIQYSAPFIPLVNLTDSVELTPTANDPNPPYNGWGTTAQVKNLPNSATDIPVLGAIIRLVQPREVQRNDMGSQPEPRKAVEVPFGSVAGSVNSLVNQRNERIKAEASRLRRRYAHRRH